MSHRYDAKPYSSYSKQRAHSSIPASRARSNLIKSRLEYLKENCSNALVHGSQEEMDSVRRNLKIQVSQSADKYNSETKAKQSRSVQLRKKIRLILELGHLKDSKVVSSSNAMKQWLNVPTGKGKAKIQSEEEEKVNRLID